MRSTASVLLAAVVLGTSAGVGAAYYQFGRPVPTFRFEKPSAIGTDRPLGPGIVESERPRAHVEGDATYDFGIMSRNERRSHTFVVRNAGDAALRITFVEKTCQCTDVTISRSEVPPNETSEITLTWLPSTFNLEFQQTARFHTNDPGRTELDLVVKGKVQQVVQAAPRSLSFDNVTVGQSREIGFDVFGYRDPDLAIDRVELLDEASAAQFETEVQSLPADKLAAEVGAVTGQRVLVRLLPGLPLGRFHQHLRVHLNKPGLGPLEVPIQGMMVGNVTLTAPGGAYQSSTGIWDLGTLAADREHEKTLWIFAKGVEPAAVQMKIGRVVPDDVLTAEITPPEPDARLARFTVTLRVRPVGRIVQHLGEPQGELAQIVIETNLPDLPTIPIPVAFALETEVN